MLDLDFYNMALVVAASATAGISGVWFYASNLIEKERQQQQQTKQDLNKIKETEKDLRLTLSQSHMENKRLRALFEIPTVFEKIDHNEKWAPLAQLFETQLSRLSCESRDLASAVGSIKTALPVAMEQLDGSAARLYVAAAVSAITVGDTVAKEIGKNLQLKNEPSALQVTVEIADELIIRVARLDTKKDGLVLLCVGKQGQLNETAWMRTLMTLHAEPELIGKTLSLQREDLKPNNIEHPNLLSIKGLSLPTTLISSLSRAGISSLSYCLDENKDAVEQWPKQVSETLRRIPKSQSSNIAFKVKLFDMPQVEIVLNKVSNGWLIAQTDLTKPDPWRLLEQVMGFLRFRGQVA